MNVGVTVPGGPVLGRRRLAQDLRRHRLLAERTIAEVAEHLGCSMAKVSRMETGAVKVRPQDLRAMVELYAIEHGEQERLFSLVRAARERGWWQEFSDVVPPGSATLYGLEDAAVSIEHHSPSLVPGLLQTGAYARALIDSAGGSNDQADRRVQLRLRRQEILARPAPCALHVLVDESVLCRRIGDKAVMSAQVSHLLEIGERPHVTIQVVPFDAGAHPGAGVAFTCFDFDGPAGAPIVYTEQLTQNSFLDHSDDIAVFRNAWIRAQEISCSPDRSREIIERRLTDLSRRRKVELAVPGGG